MLGFKDRFYLFKLNFLGEKNIYSSYKELMRNQSLTREELMALSFKKFKKVVSYAYENSPFYKDYYNRCGFQPSDMKEVGDWSKVPIIEKKDIRDNFKKIISSKTKTKYCKVSTTGGSTGAPLKVLQDTRAPYTSIRWRLKSFYNIPLSSNSASVGRNVIHPAWWRRFLAQLFWFPKKNIALDASAVDEKALLIFIKKIRKNKPKIISGYVGTILCLARYIIENEIDIPKIDLCWVTSAPISQVEKALLIKAFKGEIVDQYGSCEIPWLAFESPEHIGLYVPDDCRHVDIVNDDNEEVEDDVYGHIVVTSLDNYSFPLIRYKNGDRTKKIKNKGQLPFTLLAPIKGRVSDMIITPSGIIISGEFLTTIFDNYADSITGFQVVQHKDYSLTIKYTRNKIFSVEQLLPIISKVKQNLLEKTKNEISIEVIEVQQIPNDRGKTRYIINELTKNLR